MTIQEAVAKFKERFDNHPRKAEMLAAIERMKAEKATKEADVTATSDSE